MSTGSLLTRLGARLIGALARYLAQPVSRPVASGDVLALSPRLQPGDVLLTEGSTRAAALARRLTRSPWAHVSIYVGPLEPGDDSRCIVEADISAGVRAVPLSEFNGQRARIVRPLGLNETDRQRLADWLVSHIGAPYDLDSCLGAYPPVPQAARTSARWCRTRSASFARACSRRRSSLSATRSPRARRATSYRAISRALPVSKWWLRWADLPDARRKLTEWRRFADNFLIDQGND